MAQRFWVSVAAANHVARGRAGGFIQVNHGKRSPLMRMQPGDEIAVYSPVQTFGEKDKLQAFTAVGRIQPGEPYQGDMGGGFTPFRRDVAWWEGAPASIMPLLQHLSFTKGDSNWGYKFRFGLFEVTAEDMTLVRNAMGAA